jgi:hypothetical protein
MTCFFRLSGIASRGLFLLYPSDLRDEFGPEMLEMFEHDFASGYAARGIRGALHVWCVALREVFRIAIPAWLHIPVISVPALSAAAVIVFNSPLLTAAIRKQSQLALRPGDCTPADALSALAILGAIAALTSFLAVRRPKRAALISLGLHTLDLI